MERKGQITLELVIMLAIVINIYIYISLPIGEVSQFGLSDLGTAALASSLADDVILQANMLGLSGDGAKKEIELRTTKDFKNIECTNDKVEVTFDSYESFEIQNFVDFFGVYHEVETGEKVAISEACDFQLSCSDLPTDFNDESLSLCLVNDGGDIKLQDCQ